MDGRFVEVVKVWPPSAVALLLARLPYDDGRDRRGWGKKGREGRTPSHLTLFDGTGDRATGRVNGANGSLDGLDRGTKNIIFFLMFFLFVFLSLVQRPKPE